MPDSSTEARFAALNARFTAQLPELIASLRGLLEADGPEGAFGVIVHRLAGSAGLFGFRDIGMLAKAIDVAVDEGRRSDILAGLARLEAAGAAITPGAPA